MLKELKLELPYYLTIILVEIYQEVKKSTNLKRYLYSHVHSSFIYNSQDTETT